MTNPKKKKILLKVLFPCVKASYRLSHVLNVTACTRSAQLGVEFTLWLCIPLYI